MDIAFPAGAVLLLIAVLGVHRAVRARRDSSVEAIANVMIVDRSARTVRNANGPIVARMEDLKARMHIDWWTRSTMRIVVLRWPRGKRTIYRSCSRRQSLELLAFLNEQGLDAQ